MAALLLCVGAVMADVSSLQKGYLPPDQGYNYNAPSVPFQSPTPQPSYRPPAATITPRPPNYSTPSYPSQPTYRPSYSTPKPTYGGPNYAEEGSQSSPVQSPGAGLGGGEFDHLAQPHKTGMPYDFNYAVKDDYYGTDYAHQATSNGDQVRGEYRVLLPDGRLQIVKYLADWKDGYTAEVTYQGEAQYPPTPSNGAGSIGSAGGYPSPVIKPQPAPGYPQPIQGYPQPAPGYPQPAPGYPVHPSPSYPSPAYPVQPIPAYPSQPTIIPQKPISSYPKPGSAFGGSQQVPVSSGYPSGLPSGGYPSGGSSSGYPSGGSSGGYPSGSPSGGYPSGGPSGGYQPSGSTAGYPSGKPTPVYPSGSLSSGYPAPSKPSSGYGQPSSFGQQGSYGSTQGPSSGYGGSPQPIGGYPSQAPSQSSGGSDYGSY